MSGEAVAIVGIVVAGVVGPALGYGAAWLADRRRFAQEQRLKASDDLVARIDDVAAALEDLGASTAKMRQVVLSTGPEPEIVQPLVEDAEDAFQRARASIARLRMRPHAPGSILATAGTSTGRMVEAIAIVRSAVIVTQVNRAAGGPPAPVQQLDEIIELIDQGYEALVEYVTQARPAIAALLGE